MKAQGRNHCWGRQGRQGRQGSHLNKSTDMLTLISIRVGRLCTVVVFVFVLSVLSQFYPNFLVGREVYPWPKKGWHHLWMTPRAACCLCSSDFSLGFAQRQHILTYLAFEKRQKLFLECLKPSLPTQLNFCIKLCTIRDFSIVMFENKVSSKQNNWEDL